VRAAWWQEKQDEVMDRSWCKVAAKSLNVARLSRLSGAGGESLGGSNAWPKLACGVFGSLPENYRVPWLLHKAEHDGLLVWPQNEHQAGTTWRPSHEWDWRRGYNKSARFVAVHHKTIGVTWLSHKTKTEGLADRDGILARREASKRVTHDMIEVVALGGREGPMDAWPSNGELHVLTKMPL
jgi:hypothetical protein